MSIPPVPGVGVSSVPLVLILPGAGPCRRGSGRGEGGTSGDERDRVDGRGPNPPNAWRVNLSPESSWTGYEDTDSGCTDASMVPRVAGVSFPHSAHGRTETGGAR